MEIHSKNSYPSNKLSNFAGHRFEIDGVTCNSMEGFLQSLKFKNPDMQIEICKLIGIGAKKSGSKKNWQRNQTLYWRGQPIGRKTKEYQDLLDKAFNSMYDQSMSFRKALKASGNSTLKHTLGKNKQSETVLTTQEFISRLTHLRYKLNINPLF